MTQGRPLWRLLAPGAVFLCALVALGWEIGGSGIAAAYADPVAAIRSQDEAVYVHSSLRMVQDGDWANPKILGRLTLAKPPLLQWLTAASIQLFGLTLLSARLPALLLGAIGVAVVFAWARLRGGHWNGWPFGLVAALLLVSDPIWMTFSRLCYTDVLASTLGLLAMFTFASDPTFGDRRSRWLFGIFSGGAVLAKSIVGLLPFAALGLASLLLPRGRRPRGRAVLESGLVALLVSVPWHLYQTVLHPQWFWAEFVRHQLIAVGVAENTGVSSVALLYPRRLLEMDPVLCLFLVAGSIGLIRSGWRRPGDAASTIALSWAAVVIAGLALFRGRSVSYMVLLVPILCVLAGLLLPQGIVRALPAVMIGLVLTFAAKVFFDQFTWSLHYKSSEVAGAAGLRWYQSKNRDADLIIAAPDDEFYSMTLSLPHVRYALVGADRTIAAVSPHMLDLGVAVTTGQYLRLHELLPIFSGRLREWGLPSAESVATAILLRDAGEIGRIAAAAPTADLSVPDTWEPEVREAVRATHNTISVGGRTFLLARAARLSRKPLQPLPAPW